MFLNSEYCAKIGDFGLSTLMQGKMQTSVLGTPEYMAPEVYKGSYNTKIDIYSFGMCIIEICTKKSPYYECNSQASIYKKVISGELPQGLNQINDSKMLEFIKLCLLPAEKRPTAEQLLAHKFLIINEGDDRIHQPLTFSYSPISNQSSMSSPASLIEVSLIINDNGEPQQISFPFDLENDTPEKVAEEMVENLGLSRSYIVPVAKEIEVKVDSVKKFGSFGVKRPQQNATNMPKSINSTSNNLNIDPCLGECLNASQRTNKDYVFNDKSSIMKMIRSENDLSLLDIDDYFAIIKKGINNDRTKVKRVQIALVTALNASLRIDGFFGQKTETLVKMFQESEKVKPDGIVTEELWNKLLRYLSPTKLS